MLIYLLRHGDILNPDDILYLQMDQEIQLSELGKKQIKSQAKRLKKELGMQDSDHSDVIRKLGSLPTIYHSPLLRTTQSAKIAAEILNTQHLVPDPRLIDCGSPVQSMKLVEFDQRYQGNLYHPELTAQGGETIAQIQSRMMSALYDYQKQDSDQSILVVSHGDPIRIVQMTAQKTELTKPNLGSDRHPYPGIIYPDKGSLTILEMKNSQLTQLDYWAPIN